jgi:hypothetical protein
MDVDVLLESLFLVFPMDFGIKDGNSREGVILIYFLSLIPFKNGFIRVRSTLNSFLALHGLAYLTLTGFEIELEIASIKWQ